MTRPAMAFDYHVVDVFTDRAYAGNPLAVVLGAEDGELGTAAMQSIAREFNLSETSFVLPATTSAADYRLRIFTPLAELPFAGHPSVGTAWVMQQLGRIGTGTVVQECGAGLLPLRVGTERIELTGGTPSASGDLSPDVPLAAVGLDAADLVGTPVRAAGCGIDWVFVHVVDDAIARIQVDLQALSAAGHSGVYVFSFDGVRAHARSFAADLGVPEDPATGSAALGLGVHLVATGVLAGDGESEYVVRQGVEMGRPSTLYGTVRAESGRAVQARVAGSTVGVATGRINRPGS
jgi:trans-2,3-dihydro-3-hydroxyanthranilate isomerase